MRTTSSIPINEFESNDELLMGAYPILFLLGKGCLKKSGCTPGFKMYVNTQYDNRAAKDCKFQFTMFNQSQRHIAARTIQAKVTGNSKTIQKFIKLVNSSDFPDRIIESHKNPTSKSSMQLLKEMMPAVKIGGSVVPFGPVERLKTLTSLHAYVAFFGLPSWFITISPADGDSPLMIRLGHLHADNNNTDGLGTFINDHGEVKLKIPVPQTSEMRAIALAQNPGVAAQVFQKMIRAVIKYLFRSDIVKIIRKRFHKLIGAVLILFCSTGWIVKMNLRKQRHLMREIVVFWVHYQQW